MRGNGRIFQRMGSAFLWCAYYLRGKEYRESTGESDPNKAQKFLKRRLKEVGADQIGAKVFVGPQQERVKILDFARFAYYTGMRKGEIASLRWEDLDGDVIRLRAENAKNGKARSVPIDGELEKLIERRRAARQVKISGGVLLAALVFHHDGEAIADFRKAWATACVVAGLGKFTCRDCASLSAVTSVRSATRMG